MRMRVLSCSALALAALLAAAAPASAKQFRPGDLKLCNDGSCVVILDQGLLSGMSRLYFTGPAPAEVRKPWLGAPYFQLKTSEGGLWGITATAQLDRLRTSTGGRFGPDSWYRIPAKTARALRRLVAGLEPLRVTSSTIGRTRYG